MAAATTSPPASRAVTTPSGIAGWSPAGRPTACPGGRIERQLALKAAVRKKAAAQGGRGNGAGDEGRRGGDASQCAMGAGARQAARGVRRGGVPQLAEADGAARPERQRGADRGAVALHARLGGGALCRSP